MTTTTMHFGPEWMRAKQQPQARAQAQPSPPPASNLQSANSTYSALVSSAPPGPGDKQDEVHPFRYSKEELLRIYKESPKGSLGLEVERWEGVVREMGSDPVGLREMGEGEKKLFAGPLNSDLRRRQSTDYLSPLNTSALGNDRARLSLSSSSGAGSPLRERYPGLKRRDSNADSVTPTLNRKQSLSSLQSPGVNTRSNPGQPSPRVRQGFSSGGFDGVLGTEAWTSRRRISEASRPGAISRDSSGGESGEKGGMGQEGGGDGQGKVNGIGHGDNPSTASDSTPPGHANISVNGQAGIANSSGNVLNIPEPTDFAAVEWSYKDPSGNIQGPFRADIMQKWYDDGYFAVDLPMKRVQFDHGWSTVGELVQRSTGDKVFLSALRPVAPPGLTKRDSTSLHPVNPSVDSIFSNPYQPSPIRSLRSSTLDSFNGSNPSDSPSSSLGHFGNNSPDPLGYSGIVGNGGNPYGAQEGLGGHGFGGGMDISGLRRNHLQDYSQDPRIHSPSYGGALNHGFGNYTNQYNSVQSSPWGTAHDPFTNYNANYSAAAYGAHPAFNPQLPNQVIGTQMNPLLYSGADPNQLSAPNNQFGMHGGAGNQIGEQQSLGQGFGVQQYQQPPNPVEAKVSNVQVDLLPVSPSPKSNVPAAINTSVPATSSQSSPWGQPQEPTPPQPAPILKDASPWVLASHGVLETPWQPPVETESVGKLEKLVEEPQELHEEPAPMETPALPTPAASPPTDVPAIPTKPVKKNKVVAAAPAPVSINTPSPPASASPSLSPAPTPSIPAQKAPWAKDDKKKPKAAPAISLREIQDAEAKAAEARKARDEKERVSRLAGSASADAKEDVQPFTASWGLPTSQAGSRTTSFAKDAPAPSPTPATPGAAVWTNTSKPALKKTMKEIQEEEERRKKTTGKETVAVAVAKRAYAETTTKVTSSTTTLSGGSAWVTVGASGKANAAPATTPRPSATSIATSSTAARVNPAIRPAVQTPPSKPAVPLSGGKVEDFPAAPSHEFLEWLTKSLRGLNSSVNVEEIISMLLSFSLEPDASTTEIIQDTIYANSTILDGRRFASEFVAKRKADALNRKSGAAGKASSKPVSIAEVVKAAPKASQPEWGGFKVVNKKKKGGRS